MHHSSLVICAKRHTPHARHLCTPYVSRTCNTRVSQVRSEAAAIQAAAAAAAAAMPTATPASRCNHPSGAASAHAAPPPSPAAAAAAPDASEHTCLSVLDEPERFVLAVGGIPHVRQRLRLWQLRHNCSERVAAVKSACGLLLAAFAQV